MPLYLCLDSARATCSSATTKVGIVCVSRVAADAAFHPCIELTVRCQFRTCPQRRESPRVVVGFTIATLVGQLGWRSETGPMIRDVSLELT